MQLETQTTLTNTLVFYDGDCGLCDKVVQFYLPRTGSEVCFAPIGGETFHRLLTSEQIRALPDSIIVREPNGVVHTKSKAVSQLLKYATGFWRVLGSAMGFTPRVIADFIYDRVAANRIRVFGRAPKTCGLPTLTERSRLLP